MTKTNCKAAFEKWFSEKRKYSGGQQCLPMDDWWTAWQAAYKSALKSKNKDTQKALDILIRHAGHDGEHHLRWTITQFLKKLLDEDYKKFIEEFNSDPEYDPWDEGIAP